MTSSPMLRTTRVDDRVILPPDDFEPYSRELFWELYDSSNDQETAAQAVRDVMREGIWR